MLRLPLADLPLQKGIDRQAAQQLLPAGGARNALDCALWDLAAKADARRAWELAELTEDILKDQAELQPKDLAERSLIAVGPVSTLERGYAIVTDQASGRVITDAISAPAGTAIRARLLRGSLDATVTQTRKEDDEG